jgi:hypothetical protein
MPSRTVNPTDCCCPSAESCDTGPPEVTLSNRSLHAGISVEARWSTDWLCVHCTAYCARAFSNERIYRMCRESKRLFLFKYIRSKNAKHCSWKNNMVKMLANVFSQRLCHLVYLCTRCSRVVHIRSEVVCIQPTRVKCYIFY